ncbi:MAG: RluA family pseudouridine synthase [Acidimicrobiales bacterium]|nr:RluA family pseudouridine synthase [Acidimicrobiales bacterium]
MTSSGSPERITVAVTEAVVGQRIDRVVSLLLEVSRSVASDLIADGEVLLDGAVPSKPSVRLEAGQSMVLPEHVVPHAIQADPTVTLSIRFVDDHVIVVDKPAGLVVHPGAGVHSGTLAQGILAAFPEVANVGEPARPGIVHRLDRGTSGLLMVARSAKAYEALTEQLRSRTVAREYRALVHGLPTANEGIIDAPIGRSLRHPTRQIVRADGRPARTAYTVLERFEAVDVAFLSFQLETGRTHQIRVHADAVGHPLVGDDRYGAVQSPHTIIRSALRPFLHAVLLGFEHPTTGEWMEFESPLPADLSDLLNAVRAIPARM